MSPLKLTAIIIPMYQEQGNIAPLVNGLDELRKKEGVEFDLIAVNDGSTDNTEKELAEAQKKYPWIERLNHEKNRGMAQALKTGITAGLHAGYEIFIFMDGDLTHDPMHIPHFLNKLNEGYDLVIGSRYISGGKMVGVPLIRVWISRLGNLFGRLLLQLPLKDLTSGYRAARSQIFETIELKEKGFGIQMEELVKAYTSGYKMGEIPIILTTRKIGKSKMSYSFNFFYRYAILLAKMMIIRYT